MAHRSRILRDLRTKLQNEVATLLEIKQATQDELQEKIAAINARITQLQSEIQDIMDAESE